MTYLVILVLLVLGFILVTIEALTPGIHVFGIMGIGLVIAGIAYAFVRFGITGGGLTLIGSFVVFVAIVVITVRSGTWRRLTLESRQKRDQGYRADNASLARHVGKHGTVLHDLRPVGYVEIGGERVEAVSESEFIPKGGSVDVVRVDGVRLVVRPAPGTPAA